MKKGRSSFSGKIGFVMAAAGSAVGLGNIWRFPYLAAKDHGGIFLLCYIALAFTFGFTLLATEIAIGRITRLSPLSAYGKLDSRWRGVGVLACLVPALILPYYCVIGGWVMKYVSLYALGQGKIAAHSDYFSSYLTQEFQPIVWLLIFLAFTMWIVFRGVDHGIEKYSRILMPILLVIVVGISVYSLFIKHTDSMGITRSGIEGVRMYVVPDFTGITFRGFLEIMTDAMGQLFFSISVSMGIMITYGSYVKKDINLLHAINQIEIFDTVVAFLAGLMVIPSVYTFMGNEGMTVGPGLMFVSLPKVFYAMGSVGGILGLTFFVMVIFAALTSAVSMTEAVVASFMDYFSISRKKSTLFVALYTGIVGILVCMGYNILYFDLKLPNGTYGQLLDVLDYIGNYVLMPLIALLTCILVGWIKKPQIILDEIAGSETKFRRRGLYVVMVKYIVPALLIILMLQSLI